MEKEKRREPNPRDLRASWEERISALTYEEEIKLSTSIKEGRQICSVAQEKLSQEDIAENEKMHLLSEIEYGNSQALRARNELVEANLPLVPKLVRKYENKGVEQDDLIQEANIGLIKAADNYDWEVGRFEPYMQKTVEGDLMKAVSRRSRSLYLPRSTVEGLSKFSKTTDLLIRDLQREPTMAEMGNAMGMSAAEVVDLLYARESQYPYSLSNESNDEEDNLNIRAGKEVTIEEIVLSHNECTRLISKLEPEQQKIIFLRVFAEKSMREIAEELNITHRAVECREKSAFSKLRYHVNSETDAI